MGEKLESLPRFTRALMKSHLLACGFTYEDTSRPIIAIANSWNEFNHGHLLQRDLAEKVKQGIRSRGGMPLEFNTIAPCDALAQGYIGMNYILPSREIIADSVEAMIRSQNIVDGMVLISSCDKITPGMLMAALRLDIPCIHICSGTCVPAISFAESKRIRKDFLAGDIDEQEMAERNALLYPQPGICPYMGTANTMDIFAEALGLALPGSALIPAGTGERYRSAEQTGEAVMKLVAAGTRPSKIISRGSVDNALKVLAALSGSLNHLLHVPAIARELGMKIDFDYIGRINEQTPLLCAVNPNGVHSTADLHRAGGIPAVMKELHTLLDLNTVNVEGRTLKRIISEAGVLNREVIHPFSEPLAPEGGIVILKGNIAREGAAVRLSTIPESMMRFAGPAQVFDGEDQATEAIEQGRVEEGSVVIIRYEGPKGGPGMREMHRVAGALRTIGERFAVITDGRFSGATGGLSIGYLSPEAASDGELAIVAGGDRIEIDVKKRTLNVCLSDEEIKSRMEKHRSPKGPGETRLLRNYAGRVSSTFSGAIST